jgi:uncharacterized repeat protein (TIGR01451 family)
MRLCQVSVRALMLTACAFLFASYAQGEEVASPSATVSPLVLNFGVPGTVTGTPSAVQQVSVNISNGSLAVSVSIGGNNAGDFSETDTCGTKPSGSNMIAAPGCVINVTFTPSSPAGTKETATLNVTAGSSFSVNLTGSLGSILLFKEVNVGPSNGGATLTNMVTFNNTTVALSCPVNATASLSSSPDGSGNVLVDNFLTVRMGSNLPAQTNASNLVGNVCPANLNNPTDSGQADCFTTNYQAPAGAGGLNGLNPDTFTNSGNGVLAGGGAGGVPPISLSGFGSSSGPTTPTATISMLDGGGFVASSTLFLVTQCVPQGVAAGDTVTGNPTNPGDPSTLNQSFIFDSVNGQTSQFTTDIANNPNIAPTGTQQITQVFPIPQQLFNQLVSGTSAAPGVCVRLNSVIDPFDKTMCEGFLVQCWDPTHATLSGDNCTPSANSARNLFDFAGYDSTDAPPGQNYLANIGTNGSTVSACGGVATNCAQNVIVSSASSTMLVGPGLLLGGDQWLCAPPNPPNSAPVAGCQSQPGLTSQSAGTQYSTANCVLTGTLTGDPCPMNPLTQFKGASDPTHGITTNGKNSIFVPVVNVPLPFTQTTIAGRNANGWTQTPAPVASFISNEANYIPQSGNPVANTFVAVPPYSVTYGIASASAAAPDTTFAVSGDLTNYNTGTNPSFGTPLCISSPGPPASFISPASFPSSSVPLALAVAGGIYDLHYFTTDCALSEELLFQPTSSQLTDATANWASFRTIAFGVDNTPPTLSCPKPTPGVNATNGWFLSAPTVTCTASDDASGTLPGTASGFAPGLAAANNGCSIAISSDCIVLVGNPDPLPTSVGVTGSGAGAYIAQQQVTDLAGNVSNIQGPYNTPIDNTAPSLTAKFSVSGTTFNFGQTVTAKFTCSDTGSGLTTCGTQTVAACQAAPAANVSNFTSATAVAIDTTSSAALGSHKLYAVDCAGNLSSPVTYIVTLGSADLGIGNLPNPLTSVKNGSNLTYNIFVLNLSSNLATNVVVTNPIPANTTYVSAMSGIVSCSLAGCADLTTGSACTSTFKGSVVSSVTCATPTVKPFLPGLTGFVIKLVVNVSVPKGVTSVSDTATVSESNPDPVKGDNTFTVTTKVTQ